MLTEQRLKPSQISTHKDENVATKPTKPTPEEPATRSVTLPLADWQQIIGMLEQGTSVILSQLAMQQGGLTQVATLSALATKHIEAIKKQVG